MTLNILHNGQSISVTSHQWDNTSLTFTGTSTAAGQMAAATFIGANALSTITDIGSASARGSAAINMMPGSALATGQLTLSAATLALCERPSGKVTLNGTTNISNGSTLTATGLGTGGYTVNGTMNIDGSSTVNMGCVTVSGSGTFNLTGAGAMLRLGTVGAGETVALHGGMLSLANGMSFLGTITGMAAASSPATPTVEVYNAMNAVRETFNQTSGVLSLFSAQGTEVANLRFAGGGNLYAAPTTGLATNFIAITNHSSSNALPVTFTH